MQLAKLSSDTWIEPEHAPAAVCPVSVVGFIASVNVTAIVEPAWGAAPSAGEVMAIAGAATQAPAPLHAEPPPWLQAVPAGRLEVRGHAGRADLARALVAVVRRDVGVVGDAGDVARAVARVRLAVARCLRRDGRTGRRRGVGARPGARVAGAGDMALIERRAGDGVGTGAAPGLARVRRCTAVTVVAPPSRRGGSGWSKPRWPGCRCQPRGTDPGRRR